MPTAAMSERTPRHLKKWADYSRYERKEFHKVNGSRSRRGLKPMPKP